MLRLGLTGGIGSGKSTVAKFLHAQGTCVIDADEISRQSTAAGGAAMPEIRRQFGNAFVTAEGALNRDRMRQHVFEHPDARRLLESIIHPRVHETMARQLQSSTARCVVFDVPLLVESGRWRPQLDRVVVVDCTPETQASRVMARNGWTRDQVDKVISQQSPRVKRLACADVVVWNDGIELNQLQHVVGGLAQQLGL
jgi:dephospho-CoA kinase